MARFDIDVTELDAYAERLRQISGAGALAFQGTVNRYSALTMQEARRLVPVDTGELRDSIQPKRTEGSKAALTAEWNVTARHAAPVEYGHVLVAWGRRTDRFVPPQPYVRPALKKYRKTMIEELAQAAKTQFGTTLGRSRPQLGSVPSLVNTRRHPNV